MTLPVFPTVTLDSLTLLFRTGGSPVTTDAAGVEWLLTKFDGWIGVPAPRTQRTDRPGHPGAFRAPNYRSARIVNLEFTATAPDAATMRVAEQQVAAVCSDPGRLYPLTVTEGTVSRQVMVELDDATISTPVLSNQTTFSMRVAAPDPRKHDTGWQSPIASLGTAPSGGLDFTAPGASYTAPGASFGTPGAPSQATVSNTGTATARPLFAVQGPLPAGWRITDQISGVLLLCSQALGATDSMVINCDDFPVNNYPGHGCYLNTTIDRRASVLVPYGWPKVLPGGSATYVLQSTSFTTATMTVNLRNAWH